MAKLISSLRGKVLGEYALDKERITIGRRPTNDIQVDHPTVSGQHAIVITIGDDSFLEDLGSTNGTLVNGKLVRKHALKHADVIKIGKFQLEYTNEAMMGADPPAALDPEASSAEPPLAYLRLLNGSGSGKALTLSKEQTTLGQPRLGVAVITRHRGGHFIAHAKGTQPPLVNGNTVGARGQQLNENDIIELSGVKMEFFLGEP